MSVACDSNNSSTVAIPALVEELTPREIDILYLLFDFDLDASEIAAKLSITKGTVYWNINNIFGKLGACNRADAVCRYGRYNAEYRAAFIAFQFPQNPKP